MRNQTKLHLQQLQLAMQKLDYPVFARISPISSWIGV